MNFKVYEVSYLIFILRRTIETSFNLKRSRPEADLRQDNPTLETPW
jgi:hypothetical protein